MYTQSEIDISPAVNLYEVGQLQQAAHYLDSVVQERDFSEPKVAVEMGYHRACHFRGFLAFEMGDYSSAISLIGRAISLFPFEPLMFVNLGRALFHSGKISEAFQNWGTAVMWDPKLIEAYSAAGNAHHQLRNFPQAILQFERILELDPNRMDVKMAIISSYREMGNFRVAETMAQSILSVQPKQVGALISLGETLTRQGRNLDASQAYLSALKIEPLNEYVYSPYLMALLHSTDNRKFLFEQHKAICDRVAQSLNRLPMKTSEVRARSKIRIGYLSPNLDKHAIRHFLLPIFLRHNRRDFEIFCYHDSEKYDDASKEYQKLSDWWTKTRHLSDKQLADVIYKDDLDVLVNLAGFSDFDRAKVFLMKPAPLQISWMAYSSTTGMATMDYRIVDSIMCPPGVDDCYTEKLLRLKESVCFMPGEKYPEINSLPVERKGFFTFGCMSSFRKVNPEVLEMWVNILKLNPTSRLRMIVKTGPNFLADLNDYFASKGISKERLELMGEQNFENYLKFCHEVDMNLDTFPMGGGVTTYQSLWMGVPMLALEGQAESSRMCSMILQSAGLGQFVARSSDEYVNKAVEISGNWQTMGLAEIRRSMRSRIPDRSVQFTHDWESAIKEVVENERKNAKN